MSLGILHLTDIHFSGKNNCKDKISSLCSVCINTFSQSDSVCIVVTGDIAFSGLPDEYGHACDFFQEIKDKISSTTGIPVDILFVPGNHDCEFAASNQMRNNCVNNISYATIGTDDSVINECTSIQKNFFDFASLFDVKYYRTKLFCHYELSIAGKKIVFLGLNTAWMSSLSERPGTIFFPINRIQDECDKLLGDINIIFYHHPLAWLTPQTAPNNRRECQDYLNKISQVQLIGHEHESDSMKLDNFNGNASFYSYGKIFSNKDDMDISGFSTLIIDTSSAQLTIQRYNWKNNLFCEEEKEGQTQIPLGNPCTHDFILKESFKSSLLSIGIPLPFENDNVTLRDIFVYPDLEKYDIDSKHINRNTTPLDFISSEVDGKVFLWEGEDQIGKTSLLHMLFLDTYQAGKTVILLTGKELTSNIDSLIKRKFFEQYEKNDNVYDLFLQLNAENKILLIDDFQGNPLNAKSTHEIFKNLESKFSKIILCGNASINYSIFGLNGSGIYTIKPFGYQKTNALITRYYTVKEKAGSINEQDFLQTVRNTFDQVRHVLGNKIIPSCPIFILSIVGSLENASFDLSKTSYGYCYQNLIYRALVVRAKVKSEEIDSYINFLKILSFHFYKHKIDCISEGELGEFYRLYSTQYVIFPYDRVKEKILQSLLLRQEEDCYKFGYKYVFYFLVAKYIADKIHTTDGRERVQELFSKVYLEDCANILVFISHHSDDISFLDEAQLASLAPFENSKPITLNKGAGYYKQMLDLAHKVSTKLITGNDPIREREKSLEIEDRANAEFQNIPQEVNEVTIPFLQAYRAIDIVGQIVKNRRGSLPQAKIEELIEELYWTAFRTIGFLGDIFDNTQAELVESMKEQIGDNDNDMQIRKKINFFFQFMALQACLNVFGRLIYSVGLKDFQKIYDSVALRIGTPAAKLVSFSINSYYNKISIITLRKLVTEFKGNDVAMMILRARAKAYIYYNYVDYREKQQIADLLEMQITSLPLSSRR